jgi:hypothetical protein
MHDDYCIHAEFAHLLALGNSSYSANAEFQRGQQPSMSGDHVLPIVHESGLRIGKQCEGGLRIGSTCSQAQQRTLSTAWDRFNCR